MAHNSHEATTSTTSSGPVWIDPEVAEAVERLGAFDTASVTSGTLAQFRSAVAASAPTLDTARAASGLDLVEASIHRPNGPPIRAVVARPGPSTIATGPMTGVLYLHGGGMVAGTAMNGWILWRPWVEALPATVVSIDYRLAPEHPFPACRDDALDALAWMADHAEELGIDPARLIIAGSSAGGGVAAMTAIAARSHPQLSLAGQVLIAPMLDDRTGVSDEPPGGSPPPRTWDRVSTATGWRALLGPATSDELEPTGAVPARVADLSGLPPAIIDVGSADLFCDEAVLYAARLWHDGVRAELHVWPGGVHGFEVLAPSAALARTAGDVRLEALRRLLDY